MYASSMWVSLKESGFGGEERHAEPCAAREPDVGPVARIAVDTIHVRKDLVNALRTEHVAEFERPVRVVESQGHRLVDVRRLCGAALSDRAADVDDHGNDALSNQTGTVAANRDGHPVGGEQPVRRALVHGLGD